MPTYLDDNGNPVDTSKVYLDDNGEFVPRPDASKSMSEQSPTRSLAEAKLSFARQMPPESAAGGLAAVSVLGGMALPGILRGIAQYETVKYGGREIGLPSWAAEALGVVAGGVGAKVPIESLARLGAKSRLGQAARLLLSQVEKQTVQEAAPVIAAKTAPVVAETAAAAVPRLAAGTSTTAAARVASEMAPSVTGAASIPAAVAPRAATAAETMAEEIATRVVKLRTSTGLSEAQIASSIRELYKMTPANAKLLVRTVLSSLPK